jgi:hypothetical protein
VVIGDRTSWLRVSCTMAKKQQARVGERRWPMAAAVLLAGAMRLFLPTQLRLDDARPVALVVLVVLMVALIAGDPGRIDRQATWLRVLTGVLIGVITFANAGPSLRLVYAVIKTEPFTNNPNIPACQRCSHLAHEHNRLRAVVLGSRPWRRGRPRARNRQLTVAAVP